MTSKLANQSAISILVSNYIYRQSFELPLIFLLDKRFIFARIGFKLTGDLYLKTA